MLVVRHDGDKFGDAEKSVVMDSAHLYLQFPLKWCFRSLVTVPRSDGRMTAGIQFLNPNFESASHVCRAEMS